MRKKIFAVATLLIVASTSSVWKYYGKPGYPHAEGYNIVLLSLDTTRADFLGCYGNPVVKTPNINKLADRGVLFENYYSTINTTLAAHASMFTGYYPRNHGVGRNSMRLHSSHLTLAEYLTARGYTTAGFIGSFALASVFGINQGFQTYDESFLGETGTYVVEKRKNAQKEEMETVVLRRKVGHLMRPAENVNQSFFFWLRHNSKGPFFAFLHYYDPHFPYAPPPRWISHPIPVGTPMTQGARNPMENHFQELIDPSIEFYANRLNAYSGNEIILTLLDLYRAEIEYVDHAVGQVVAELTRLGLDRNTILILTADHGENLVEHHSFNSFFRHGYLLFDTETKIPLILVAPGVLPKGKRIQNLSSQIDFFCTVVDLLGLKVPVKTDGISLVPMIFGKQNDSNRTIFMEASQPRVSLRRDASRLRWINDWNAGAVRWQQYKYINAPYRQFEGIYDLARDSQEQHNLIFPLTKQNLKLVDQLRSYLENWRAVAFRNREDREFQITEEQRENLESLGYVQ